MGGCGAGVVAEENCDVREVLIPINDFLLVSMGACVFEFTGFAGLASQCRLGRDGVILEFYVWGNDI